MIDRLKGFDWPLFLILLGITAFHLLGVRQVPFHPDESSLLYQSADLEAWLHDPLSLAWDPSKVGERDQKYRALNTPLPKIVLGVGRWLAGQGPETVAVDWDWSKSWEDNRRAGALPGDALLTSARLANILLLPLSLLLIYRIGLRIDGRTTGLVAVVLLGMNALVLLHARRAMAEGSVIFGVSLAVFGFVQARERPWLAGLGAATAALAKLSAVALAPVGLALALWPRAGGSAKVRAMVSRALMYLGAFAAEVVLLDPFLWRQPIQAMAAMWRARLDFSAAQVSEIGAIAPSVILRSPSARLASLIGNTFLVPPQFAEVGNYLKEIAPQVQAYLAIPGNAILRGVVAGGLILLLCLLGIGTAAIRFPKSPAPLKDATAALTAASLVQTIALYLAIMLPFQRYYVPLLPFACLWAAYGVTGVVRLILANSRGSSRAWG